MLKKFWPALVLVGFADAAVAGNIIYDFRFDMRSANYTENAGAQFDDGYRYEVETGRIDFKGKLNDSVDYRLLWRFDRPQVASTNLTTGKPSTNLRDGIGDWVQLAYVQQRISDHFTITLGKFFSDMGGMENINPYPDEYLFSEVYNDATSGTAFGNYSALVGGVPYNLAIVNSRSYAGIKLAANFSEGQEIAIHFANNQDDTGTTDQSFSQNKGWVGLVYKGKFFDEVWNPVVSLHSAEAAGTIHSKRSYAAIGNNIKIGDWAIEGDLLANNVKDDLSNEVNIGAVSLQVGYNVGHLTPKFKLAESAKTVKTATTSTEAKINSAAVILEYKPKTEENFRYHVAYIMNDYRPDATVNFGAGAGTAISERELVMGLRIAGDFLK